MQIETSKMESPQSISKQHIISKLLSQSLQAYPFPSFLVLAVIYILAVLGTIWLMVQLLAPKPAIDDGRTKQKQCREMSNVDGVRFGVNGGKSKGQAASEEAVGSINMRNSSQV